MPSSINKENPDLSVGIFFIHYNSFNHDILLKKQFFLFLFLILQLLAYFLHSQLDRCIPYKHVLHLRLKEVVCIVKLVIDQNILPPNS